MKTAKDRYNSFIQNILTPFLKLRSFKKKGNRFIFYEGELAYVIHILRGNFNNNDFVSFSLHLKIYERNFMNKKDSSVCFYPLITYGKYSTENYAYFDTIKLSTGEEWQDNKDRWLKELYIKDIETYIFALISQFKTIEDIIYHLQFASSDARYWDFPGNEMHTTIAIALLYWFKNKYEDATKFLNTAIALLDKKDLDRTDDRYDKLMKVQKMVANKETYDSGIAVETLGWYIA